MRVIGSKIDEIRIDGCLAQLEKDLDAIGKMGIKAVELPAHGFDVIFNGKIVQHKLDDLLAVLSKFDFHFSVHSPNPLNLMDRTDAGLHAAVLQASLELARQAGARVVVYHAGRFIPEEEFAIFPVNCLTCKEKTGLLEKEALLLQSISKQYPDVTIAIENARPYLDRSPYSYGEIIDDLKAQVVRINRDNVKINLDFGHLHMTSRFYGYDLKTAVRSIKSLVAHTHIHDNFGGAVHHWEKQQTHQLPFGRGDSHMPVGWGSNPIKDILEILLPEYAGLLMMELRSRYFNSIETSKQNLETILDTI